MVPVRTVAKRAHRVEYARFRVILTRRRVSDARETHGLITRTVHPVVPPHVDYAITPLGSSAVPAIEVLRAWGAAYRKKRS